MLVDRDDATFFNVDAGFIAIQPVAIGAPADRYQDPVVDLSRRCILAFKGNFDAGQGGDIAGLLVDFVIHVT